MGSLLLFVNWLSSSLQYSQGRIIFFFLIANTVSLFPLGWCKNFCIHFQCLLSLKGDFHWMLSHLCWSIQYGLLVLYYNMQERESKPLSGEMEGAQGYSSYLWRHWRQYFKEKNACSLPLAWRVDVDQSHKYRWMNWDEWVACKVGSPSDSGQCQEQGMKRTE